MTLTCGLRRIAARPFRADGTAQPLVRFLFMQEGTRVIALKRTTPDASTVHKHSNKVRCRSQRFIDALL